jgi:Sulfotransferase domain
MSELRNLLERARNRTLRMRLRQATNVAIAAALGRPLRLIHVVEYPKCGGSWVRNMLATYTGTVRFLDDRLLRRGDVVQVHRLPKPWYRRAVVVTRDPRDMYVSTYYHETQYRRREKHILISRYFQHDPSRPLREDFAAYLEAKLSHHTHPPFMLHEFVRAWKARPGAVWMRYEDCLANGEAELARMVQALGLPFDPERVRQAVEANSFQNATRARGKERKPGEADAGSFERKGVAGDWKNHFDRRSCELLERYEGASLRALGYEPDDAWIERFLTA